MKETPEQIAENIVTDFWPLPDGIHKHSNACRQYMQQAIAAAIQSEMDETEKISELREIDLRSCEYAIKRAEKAERELAEADKLIESLIAPGMSEGRARLEWLARRRAGK